MKHPLANALDDAALDETRTLFQPYSREPLSREDAREIHRNLTGAFQVLLEWKRDSLARRSAQAAVATPPAQSEVADD
mgnify:FL=1